jgi:hypothetical protein
MYWAVKKDEVTGNRRRLHDEEHHDPYSSHDIVRVIKSRRMRWERRMYWVLVGKSAEESTWEGLGVNGRIILKCIKK